MKTNAIANIRRRNLCLAALTIVAAFAISGYANKAQAGGFSFMLNTGRASIGIGIGDGGGLYAEPAIVAPQPRVGYAEPPRPHRVQPLPPQPRPERLPGDMRRAPIHEPQPIVRGAAPYRGEDRHGRPSAQDWRYETQNHGMNNRRAAPAGGPLRAPQR